MIIIVTIVYHYCVLLHKGVVAVQEATQDCTYGEAQVERLKA